MEKKQKTLHVYYKGSEQRIKLFDGTKEDKILKLIKRVFKLTVSDDKIFFQDENGDLVILPDIFPQDLSIYIYIEPEYPEPKKQIDNVEHSKILPGFKWTFAGGTSRISDDGYIFNPQDQSEFPEGWNSVHSTTTYTKGQLFCKLLWNPQYYQSIGVVSPDDNGERLESFTGNSNVVNSGCLVSDYGGPYYISFLLNMDKQYMKFFILDGKDGNVKKTKKITFNFPQVVIYAGGKTYGSIQILEGGSSPIPEYALKE